MNGRDVFATFRDFFEASPLNALAALAAAIALATTPIAFAVLSRRAWFQARRGRTLQRPSFLTAVVAMMTAMGIPAILLALLVKSQYFDKDRYEFDPNRTISVLDQGREFETLRLRESLYKADEAVRAEQKRLAEERKNLVENVKKLDEAMIALRAAASQAPATARTLPRVLETLAGIRRSVGVDAPQQLIDEIAPPAALANAPTPAANAPTVNVPPPVAAPAAGNGLGPEEVASELASVPEPQKPLAAMLPLTDVPAGWVVVKEGDRHLETFNADNLFEKIDGRAESFIQYDVRGMAYADYHPEGDDSADVQLYIYEMGSPLKALGKYGSEKPDGAKPLEIGSEGYTSAGSTIFYAGKYYNQLISTRDDPKFAAFAVDLAKKVAAKQVPESTSVAGGKEKAAGPEDVLKLLPGGPEKSGPKYVAQDVFGYSFLSDVFMADYREGDAGWQGFLRPYESPEAAKAVFEKYLATAREDGAEVKEVEGSGADRMIVSANIGLFDVIFLKGNTVAGANGAPKAEPAEKFARDFAGTLPKSVPTVGGSGE